MSKLEVREIGPISGETEVRLADGATAVGFGGGGKVLQVVSESTNVHSSTTSTTDWVPTGLEATITPTSINSKIFIVMTCCLDSVHANAMSGIAIFDKNSSKIQQTRTSGASSSGSGQITLLDSPASTSPQTYQIKMKLDSASTMNFNLANGSATSSITLMEIAG